MKLFKLIECHQSSRSNDSLKSVLGDAYLLKHNLVYRNIRNLALQLGYKFEPAQVPYFTMAEIQLDEILKSKVIPYIENLDIFKEIEKKKPQTFSLEQLPSKAQSYHFHESAHCVAEAFFNPAGNYNKREKVLKLLMCESFANCVEALSLTYASTPAHRELLMQNSYHYTNREKTALRLGLLKQLGFEKYFVITFYSFLYSNFLFTSVPKSELRQLLARLWPDFVVSKKLLVDLVFLFKMSCALNPGFRLRTTSFYFQMNGIDGDILKILNFDFLSVIEKQNDFRHVAVKMAKVLEAGLFDAAVANHNFSKAS